MLIDGLSKELRRARTDLATLRRKLDDALRVAGELAAENTKLRDAGYELRWMAESYAKLMGEYKWHNWDKMANAYNAFNCESKAAAAYRALTADGPTETKS